MACRRKRISVEQAATYVAKVRRLPISAEPPGPNRILALPELALKYNLTNYDAAYLDLAIQRGIALATTDDALRRAAAKAGVGLLKPA